MDVVGQPPLAREEVVAGAELTGGQQMLDSEVERRHRERTSSQPGHQGFDPVFLDVDLYSRCFSAVYFVCFYILLLFCVTMTCVLSF